MIDNKIVRKKLKKVIGRRKLMKRILVHICCAPCFVAPYYHLKEKGNLDVYGFWFNPNIHPYIEYFKRKEAVLKFTKSEDIKMIWKDEYKLDDFLRKAAYRENSRCAQCYFDRLNYAAIIAKKGNFDYFTSTLLYSKYQNHDLIISIAQDLAKKHGVEFYYDDFRKYWQEGIDLSKEKEMYRQQYCGCVYSERDRYQNQYERKWQEMLKGTK
jgi:predicted adenine nucleotide alpha hydrolase (AANH) superfamily ATPase